MEERKRGERMGGRGVEKVRVKGKRLEGRPVVVTTSLIVYYFV